MGLGLPVSTSFERLLQVEDDTRQFVGFSDTPMLDVVFFGWPLALGGMSVMVGGVDD